LVKRILVPLDGSRAGEAVIPAAEALAHALGAEVVLFEVLEPVVGRVGAGGVSYIIPRDKEIKKALMAYLDSVGKRLKERGLNTSSVVVSGFPAEQISDYAEANAIDLIAMSSRGRSGASRWVFGSVTDKVLHTGDTAVLVVQAPKT
jgi:nucleotide-binding universal stress UspA family protein